MSNSNQYPSRSFTPIAGVDLPEIVVQHATSSSVSQIISIPMDRRHFLKLSGLATSGLLLAFGGLGTANTTFASNNNTAGSATPDHFDPNGYLHISPDGKILIVAITPEIGQGVKTAFPMVVAEELDVLWDHVTVEQSAIDYARFGPQFAGGSMGTPIHFDRLRKAGATGRKMLISAAAKRWNVPEAECSTEPENVIHKASGQRLSYADLCLDAATLPIPEEVTYKDKKDYRILGQWKPGVDNHAIVTGKSLFGYDLQLPGMKVAMYVKCPTVGGVATEANLGSIKAIPGIIDAFLLGPKGSRFQLLSGVAIIGDSTWAVIKAANQVQVKWDLTNASKDTWSDIVDRANEDLKADGEVTHSQGDFSKAESEATTAIEGTYQYDFVAHAPMEPMNCTAHYHDATMELWAPTQTPQGAGKEVAAVTNITPENVNIHQLRIGGGFGRRLTNDYLCEVAAIAEKVDYPVKLIWTREQDFAHDHLRVGGIQRFKGTLDDAGKLTGWKGHFVTFNEKEGNDHPARGAGMDNHLFPFPMIPHLSLQRTMYPLRIPVSWWRAPGSCTMAWMLQSFLHELSTAAKRDHVEFLLELLGEDRWFDEGNWDSLHTGRAKDVIKLAAEMGNWGKPMPKGQGRGIAFYFCHKGYFAEVAEVSVNASNQFKLDKVIVAGDVGPILNRAGAENQIEGSVVDGYSSVLGQSISFSNGVIKQSNFHDYPLLRMSAQPEIEIHMIESDFRPTGLGEPALPPLGPALCNALFAATGKRIRKLPLINEGFSV